MIWLLFALLGYFLLAVVFILDKFILTKTVERPAVYGFYSTIFMFAALLAWPLGVGFLSGSDWLWAIVSGVAFGLGLWTLFIAVKKGEASHIDPFNGAVVTISTYLLAAMVLGERLNQTQLLGIALLLAAALLLSFEKTKSRQGFHAGFAWAALSGFLFAISHVLAKHLYALYPFLTGFVWTRAATGLVGLVLLLSPAVRQSLGRRRQAPKTSAKRHRLGIVLADKVLGIAAVVLIQYAMALGSVSLVTALSGLQFALMFALVYLLTKFAPRVFQEYFSRGELITQTIGILLVVAGSALFIL